MKFDHPTPEQIPALRSLWKEAFGDSDAFLDSFFATGYSPQRCRCTAREGSPAAALYWFDVFCGEQKLAYIYAVATAEASQGQGLCRALMEDTAGLLTAQSYHGALLVPQNEGLARMYGKMGYLPATSIHEELCTAVPAHLELEELRPAEYAARRSALLPPGSVEPESAGMAFLSTQTRFYAAPGLLAAVSREEEHLRILEYLGEPDAAGALVAALGRTEATLRRPGGQKPFAMYLPLSPHCRKPEYFAFCFD